MNHYQADPYNALEAISEAQKIAFGPMLFQASWCLRETGVLAYLEYHQQHPHESLAAHVGLGRSDPMLRWADETDNTRQMQRILDAVHEVAPTMTATTERDLTAVIYGWLAFTLELCRQRIIDPSLDAGRVADTCAHALLDALGRVAGIPDELASAAEPRNR